MRGKLDFFGNSYYNEFNKREYIKVQRITKALPVFVVTPFSLFRGLYAPYLSLLFFDIRLRFPGVAERVEA